ncbi:MAG: ABC transporter ATP-binding protein [Acidobacteria bacterium]|nr:MAG: ABC transporter ATP-binding protein [Acidobacteriota bacterium]
MLAIETRDLTKDYWVGFWRPRPYRALDRLSISVEPGDVFGFLGPNGAGKTTTLKLLNHLVHPTSGDARLFGRPVGDVALRRRIGFLPESPYFYDHLTAEELLSYFARLFGIGRAEARQRASSLLDRVGIGAERRFALRKLSKGMLQRVGLAQALVNEPDLVFLDEPMSGLDPIGRMDVRKLILELRDRGCTVFFSSHILSDAEALCSRVAILSKGVLVASGGVEEMLAFGIRGWELIVADLPPSAAASLRQRGWGAREISAGRYAFEIPAAERPDGVLAEVLSTGASLVSLNPVRQTLEEFFVERVSGTAAPGRPDGNRGAGRVAESR